MSIGVCTISPVSCGLLDGVVWVEHDGWVS